jgi:hypothetical protein
MATFACVLHTKERVLLSHDGRGQLRLIGGKVQAGESALQACVRAIEATLQHRLMPSCAGIFFVANPGHLEDYGVAFIAEAPEPAPPVDTPQEWIPLADLDSRPDLSPVERELIPAILRAEHPISVVLTPDPDSDPVRMRIVATLAIDGATLGPLVFAELPG